jgi:uncharacterized repeat protein (TIGR03803 family)
MKISDLSRSAMSLCADGELPFADLVNVNGTLYGTTNGGGASGLGTVFSITL